MMFVPKTDYRLNDQWHVAGLQGTDSNTVVVENAFVPHHRVYWLERAERTGTLSWATAASERLVYKLPFIPTLGVALVPVAIGSVRSAIAHFEEWTRARIPVYGPERAPLCPARPVPISLWPKPPPPSMRWRG